VIGCSARRSEDQPLIRWLDSLPLGTTARPCQYAKQDRHGNSEMRNRSGNLQKPHVFVLTAPQPREMISESRQPWPTRVACYPSIHNAMIAAEAL